MDLGCVVAVDFVLDHATDELDDDDCPKALVPPVGPGFANQLAEVALDFAPDNGPYDDDDCPKALAEFGEGFTEYLAGADGAAGDQLVGAMKLALEPDTAGALLTLLDHGDAAPDWDAMGAALYLLALALLPLLPPVLGAFQAVFAAPVDGLLNLADDDDDALVFAEPLGFDEPKDMLFILCMRLRTHPREDIN